MNLKELSMNVLEFLEKFNFSGNEFYHTDIKESEVRIMGKYNPAMAAKFRNTSNVDSKGMDVNGFTLFTWNNITVILT